MHKGSRSNQLFTPQFFLLCLSSLFFFASFNMIIPELPAYLTSLGGGEWKGLIISLFALTAGFSRPFSGVLTDRWGRVPVMIFGSVVCIVAGLLYPIFNTVAGFFIIRVFHGLSTGFKPTGTSSYIGDVAPISRRGEAMGLFGVFGSTGMALGPVLGSEIAIRYGINAMFYASSGLAFLSVIVLLGMKETLENPSPFSIRMLRIRVPDILEKRVWPSSLVMFMGSYGFGTILTVVPDLSTHIGLQNRGTFFLYMTIATLLIRFFAGRASDRFGRVNTLLLGSAIIGVGMYFVGAARYPDELLFAAIVFGAGMGISTPTIFAWNIDLSNIQKLGKAMATMYIALELGIIAGSFISGLIYSNNAGNFSITFWSAGMISLVAIVFLSWFRKRTKRLNGSNFS